nr:DUF29 family protein [Duganella sp. 1411]
MALLVAHLLKWAYQQDMRGHSWVYTIREQRAAIQQDLVKGPRTTCSCRMTCPGPWSKFFPRSLCLMREAIIRRRWSRRRLKRYYVPDELKLV